MSGMHGYIRDNEDRLVRLDASTHSIRTITYGHHEIHAGSSYSVHLVDLLFQKDEEVGVIFTTPNTEKWLHVVPIIDVEAKSTFDILEAPTVNVAAYPTNFIEPHNRNRNSAKTSQVSSVRAAPVKGEVSLVVGGDASPVSADGLVLHTEILGGKKKKTAGDGVRDTSEYILKQNTTYYFRVLGDNTGDNDLGFSMELTWYEHTDKN